MSLDGNWKLVIRLQLLSLSEPADQWRRVASKGRWLVPIAVVAIAAGGTYANSDEATPVPIERSLIRTMAEAHTRLRAAVQCCSGTIEYQWEKLGPTEGGASGAETTLKERLRFAVCGANVRLDYLPFSGAPSEPSPSRVLIQRADTAYEYTVPDESPKAIATLYNYDDPLDPRVGLSLAGRLIRPLRSLYQVGDTTVIDVLQRPEVEIVRKSYRGVADALWVRGVHRSAAGEETVYSIVLDPAIDYAVIYSEAESTGGRLAGRIRSEITPGRTLGGAWIPRLVKVAADARMEQSDDEAPLRCQEIFQFSVEPQEYIPPHTFDEAWFRRLGRTFVVMHVAVDGSTRMGKATSSVEPLRSGPLQPIFSDSVKQSGGLRGWLLLLNGIALLVIAVVLTYRWRRHSRGPSS